MADTRTGVAIEPWGAVERLIAAGGRPGTELSAELAAVGFHEAVAVLLDELVERCDPVRAADDRPIVVQLEVSHADHRANRRAIRRLVFTNSEVAVTTGAPHDAEAKITFSLTDLTRAMFGTVRQSESANWTHRLLVKPPTGATEGELVEFRRRRQLTAAATNAILAAASPQPASLDHLAVQFGSDKWGALHWYTRHYHRHFHSLRDEPVRLLEIGVGGYDDPRAGGGSLRMWQRYFRRGLVCGLDRHEKHLDSARVRVVRGDQNDPAFLTELASRIGPLDVVIDDGSHVNEHVLTSFRTLFPLLAPGGVYVIEDLQTSYWPSYGGSSDDLNSPLTSVGMVKSLLDGLHYQEYRFGPGQSPSYVDQNVAGVHVYHNLVFVVKGRNDECGPARSPM